MKEHQLIILTVGLLGRVRDLVALRVDGLAEDVC